jgi:transcriptional regulator with XRE-family HTH domain
MGIIQSAEVIEDTSVIGLHDSASRLMLSAVATISDNIRAAREARGWTQSELAKRAGVVQARISDWERSRYRQPDISSLLKLANALEVTLDDLVAGIDTDYEARRKSIDAGRSTRRITSPPPGEEPRDASSIDPGVLEKERQAHAETLAAIKRAAADLLRIAGRRGAGESGAKQPEMAEVLDDVVDDLLRER